MLISALFVVQFVRNNWDELRSVDIVSWSAIGFAALSYSLSVLLSLVLWPLVLRALGSNVQIAPLFKIGLLSQIGKYIPGNVAHYLGRSALAKARGVSFRETGVSSVVELILAFVCAVVIAAAALAIEPAAWEVFATRGGQATLGLLAAAAVTFAAIVWMRVKGIAIVPLLGPISIVLLSQLFAGASFYGVVIGLGGEIAPVAAIGAFVGAWLIGFVTPGAPAGIGLREAIIIALVSSIGGAALAIAAALLHRALTAILDAGFAVAGSMLAVRQDANASARMPARETDG